MNSYLSAQLAHRAARTGDGLPPRAAALKIGRDLRRRLGVPGAPIERVVDLELVALELAVELDREAAGRDRVHRVVAGVLRMRVEAHVVREQLVVVAVKPIHRRHDADVVICGAARSAETARAIASQRRARTRREQRARLA